MTDLIENTAIQAILGVGFLCVAVYFAYHLILRLRPSTHTDDTSAEELVRNFKEMRLEGDISEADTSGVS